MCSVRVGTLTLNPKPESVLSVGTVKVGARVLFEVSKAALGLMILGLEFLL